MIQGQQYKFTDKEYEKVSIVTGVPLMEIKKMDAQGLLSYHGIMRSVINYEYKLQRKKNKVMPRLIIRALAQKFGLTNNSVSAYLFNRVPDKLFCAICQKETPKAMYLRNKGICDKCVVNNIAQSI